ncbi:MAG: endonuclease MutS2 [Candidatus Baltobacteraceae bacterium]
MGGSVADPRTLDTLDFASVRGQVVAAAVTDRGRRYAAEMHPAADFAVVRREQAATDCVRSLIAAADMHILPAADVEEPLHRAAIGTALSAIDLRAAGDALASAAAAFNRTREAPGQALAHITQAYVPLKDVQRALTDAIDERGVVLERASPALGRIRKNIVQAQTDARDRVTALLRSAKYANVIQDAVVTIREGRFVVPIKAEFGGEVAGIVHDTSSSGQTLFVEPIAALEANNRVRTLRVQEENEIARILQALSGLAGAHAVPAAANLEMLAQLDVLVAKARVAQTMDAHAPELVEEAGLFIDRGRHPLLGDRAVPQTVELNEQTRLVVISGPNMGGKTVALKMVGLFVAMTYAGMQIPAAPGSRIGRFAQIFTDIGDEQSIAQNASTFSAHLRRMREIFEGADARSLVLVDEIGGGTEPASGAALAIAMLERLLEVRARGIVTTHATELKLFAHQTPGAANASVRFDPDSFAPTYYLDVGMPGQSLAFPLARALGIPREIIARADALLGSRERDYESALAELAQLGAQMQRQREAVERERVHVDRLQETLRSRAEALERERRTFAETAEARLGQALRTFSEDLAKRAAQQQSTRAKITPAQSALLNQTLEQIRRDIGVTPERAPANEGVHYEPGDTVRVHSFGQEATIIADNGQTLLVAMGAMRTVVEKRDVQRAAPAKKARSGGAGAARLEAAARTMSELDVRGKRYSEAEPLVEAWIDEAVLAGNTPLRLIHGKGTGMLGRGLQEFLRGHPQVKNVRYGGEDEGGGGVSVFELR